MSTRSLLRLEGALVFGASIVAYNALGGSWWFFFILLLTPDVFMVGYLANPRIGANLYNLGHTYAMPLVIGGVALGVGSFWAVAVAVIWTAHIGLDRALGYGLKRPTAFTDTHLSIEQSPAPSGAANDGSVSVSTRSASSG